MKHILVPIGISPDAHKTLQYAVDFASQFDSQIYVMEVFNVSVGAGKSLANVPKKLAESGKERLKAVIDQIDTKSTNIKIATYNGAIVDGLKDIDKKLGIDLIIMAPRSNDITEAVYLGNTSGKIIKQTDIPTLIVPKGIVFSPPKVILTAFKSGILKRNRILNPLLQIKSKFRSVVNLLMVKTPGYTDADLRINTGLMDISSQIIMTEAPTTYLGVLERFESQQPDLLCVFRHKRGFFKKLWEKNVILKSEFSARIPVLVLSVKKD